MRTEQEIRDRIEELKQKLKRETKLWNGQIPIHDTMMHS